MKSFNNQKEIKVTNRSSSITGVFVKSMLPVIQATEEQELEVFDILGLDQNNPLCAYCRVNVATDWDHFRPTVNNKTFTGYLTEIFNAVPACGTCNQSKSGSYWKDWIQGKALLTPKNRFPELDLERNIELLDQFEQWSNEHAKKIHHNEFSKELKDLTKEYFELRDRINDELKSAQKMAEKIKGMIKSEIQNW